ncbi:MAG TPA: hypothetical protein VH417_02900 [Vicinamibacterales bacterium]
MSRYRLAAIAGACAIVLGGGPARAQGNSQNAHGNSGSNSNGNGNASGRGKSGKANTPNQTTLPPPTGIGGPAAATPFAWVDNATLMAPGRVWIGTSMVRWHGDGLTEVSAPVIDAAVGIAPRAQFAVSLPRVLGSDDPAGPPGGWGTTFANVKIGLVSAGSRGFNLAAAPTIELLSEAAVATGDRARVQWGLPVSADVERGAARIYGSTGYFSPGVWFAGAGIGTPLRDRVGVSFSFSRSWSSSASSDPAAEAPKRNDLSAGASFDITGSIALFGSFGQTIATSPQYGGGHTISVGLALTTASTLFQK